MVAALDDVFVVDFTHVFAGPYCTMTLADMGAEVIKIESPRGDAVRGYTPPDIQGASPSFLLLNRNKKGMVLDLWKEEGKNIVLDLIKRADVIVENFSTGVMDRLGLDYESLAKINPRLIYCSISAYGRSGPLAQRAGYDPVIQAETGIMSVNGDSSGDPHRTGIAFVDLCGGMFATQAILAALYSRCATGKGQYIDVPLFDTGVSLTSYHTMNYLASGEHPGRLGNKSVLIAPIGLYDAADGQFFLTVGGDKIWDKMVAAMGHPEELTISAYATNTLRMQSVQRLDADLQFLFSKKNREYWIERLRDAGVPVGPVRSIAETVNSPEVKLRAMIQEVDHESLGKLPNIRLPMQMMGTPLVAPRGAPLLGADTHSILRDVLHYDDQLIEKLQVDGVLGELPDRLTQNKDDEH